MADQAQLFERPHRNECVFSPCRRYRYLLRRVISESAPHGVCLWLLANPSKADEYELDPTLRRCADYTARWGYREMRVVNVRAWVETESSKVPEDWTAIGPDNVQHVLEQAAQAELVVCGWGRLGGSWAAGLLERVREVAKPHALWLNQDGSPQHPLYLLKTLKPFPMEARRG